MIDYIGGSAGNRWNRLLNKLIKVLLRYKLRKQPEWTGTTFSIDEMTDVHCIVETWRNGRHFFGIFGTRGEQDAID